MIVPGSSAFISLNYNVASFLLIKPLIKKLNYEILKMNLSTKNPFDPCQMRF